VRWSNRDTYNYDNNGPLDTRAPLVVVNDALDINISNTKQGMSPTCSIQLKGGDLNYATAVHPGDFVMVNMLNWPKDAMRVRQNALARKAINKVGDGFKGMFKIQSVVKNVTTQKNGMKTLTYSITAAGFTEFNNTIYYNPAIAAAFSDRGTNLYQILIGEFYQDKLKTNSEVQIIMKDLFKILLGKSSKDRDVKIKNFGNKHFKVPTLLGQLLGKNKAQYANEIYNYILGIWTNDTQANTNDSNIALGFNPKIEPDPEGNFFRTPNSILGNKEVFIENWNNSTAWSILQQNLNSVLNEMYTTYRVAPDGSVQPTVVVRQKPFTTKHFYNQRSKLVPNYQLTLFEELPRWKISANLMLQQQTSKNDAARFNFVQVYTRSLADVAEQDMAQQISQNNFVEDPGDIQRNGLRPYVVRSNFDFPTKDRNKRIRAPEWAKIVSDWIIDGHLKESGTFVFYGIQDPISVGDNIEFDDIVYQIETINHKMNIAPNGTKTWRTTVNVSYGMSKGSSVKGPVYANMEHTDAYTERIEDFENERILPGIGDTQDLPGRSLGEETKETRQGSFTPPDLRKTRQKTQESNTGQDSNFQQNEDGKSRKKT